MTQAKKRLIYKTVTCNQSTITRKTFINAPIREHRIIQLEAFEEYF